MVLKFVKLPVLALALFVGVTLDSCAADSEEKEKPASQNKEARQDPPQDEMPESVDEVIRWKEPVVQDGEGCSRTIVIEVEQLDGWHIYAQELPEGAISIPTSFAFKAGDGYALKGGVQEPEYTDKVTSGIPERYYTGHDLTFTQEIEVNSTEDLIISLDVEFMACKYACFPPKTKTFEIKVKGCK